MAAGALALAALLAGCSTDDGTVVGDAAVVEDAAPGVRVVTPGEAEALLAITPAPVVIDVRTPGEFAAGHIAGAVLVDYNAPDFREQIANYDPAGSYVIYCRSGNRSAGAREVMTELGFTDVADIEGGIVGWVEDGGQVTS